MATLMRCHTAVHLGDKFIPAGTILPAGHPDAVPQCFEVYEVEGREDVDHDALRSQAERLGVKVDKRWGADRLTEEIAAATKG